MKDGSAFGLAGLWENWKDPTTDEWTRTFAVLTTAANALVADIHDRMPVILRPEDYERRLGVEPDRRDLLRPFPGRADAHVADLGARELAEERRRGPSLSSRPRPTRAWPRFTTACRSSSGPWITTAGSGASPTRATSCARSRPS